MRYEQVIVAFRDLWFQMMPQSAHEEKKERKNYSIYFRKSFRSLHVTLDSYNQSLGFAKDRKMKNTKTKKEKTSRKKMKNANSQ